MQSTTATFTPDPNKDLFMNEPLICEYDAVHRAPGVLSAVSPARTPMRPTATVRAYVAAINGHHYARAWRLGGRNTGGSYPSFVSGFTGTAKDTLTIVSVSGDVVTARLSARQADGSVNIYQGTYTVHHGVITGFDVVQLS